MSSSLSRSRLRRHASFTHRKQKAKSQPSSFFKPIRSVSARKGLYIAVAAIAQTLAGNTYAGPEGGNVTGGTGTITTSGNTTTINQTTQNMAIDWNSYNVGVDERVEYIQPDSTSVSLNRITSYSGSEIQGRIDANGQVILMNPNGVFFSSTAVVNVGGLLATGLTIDPADFMNGESTFSVLDGTDGVVINNGLINAASGGSVALVGQRVENNGLINAQLGTVSLAAGNEAILTFDANRMIGVRVSKAVLQDDIGVDAAVINSGEINSASGNILLTASVSEDIFSQAVNHSGLNTATSVVVHEDGSFTLGEGADVVNTGTLNASQQIAEMQQTTFSEGDSNTLSDINSAGNIVVLGENVTSNGQIYADSYSANQNIVNGDGLITSGVSDAGFIEIHSVTTTELTENSVTSATAYHGGKGGGVKVLGQNVGVLDSAEVIVSGAQGGGQLLVGGDETGANELIRNADFIYIGENTTLSADGLINGDGGKLITFASDTARIYGSLTARGGNESGYGGFVETSGLINFEIFKTPNVDAIDGGGHWLIDPYNIEIVDSGITPNLNGGTYTSSDGGAQIAWSVIEDFLDNGRTLTLQTGGDEGNITLSTPAFMARGNSTNSSVLNLIAHNNIIINDTISTNEQDSLSLIFQAGQNIEVNASINTSGGDFTATANYDNSDSYTLGDFSILGTGSVTTEGGDFTVTSTNFTLGDQVTTSTFVNTGGGALSVFSSGDVKIYDSLITGGGDLTIGNDSIFSSSIQSYFDAIEDDLTTADIDESRALDVGIIDTSGASGGGSITLQTVANASIDDASANGNIRLGDLIFNDNENSESDPSGDNDDANNFITIISGNNVVLEQELNYSFTGDGRAGEDDSPLSLTIYAQNDITINESIYDSRSGSLDTLSLTLIADSDLSSIGDININNDIYTGGGDFNALGVNFNSFGFTITSDLANNGIDQEEGSSDSVSSSYFNSGDLYLNMTGDANVGILESDSEGRGSVIIIADNLTLGSQDVDGDVASASSIITYNADVNLFVSGDINIYDDISTGGGILNVGGDHDSDSSSATADIISTNFNTYFAGDSTDSENILLEESGTISTSGGAVNIKSAGILLNTLGSDSDSTGEVEITDVSNFILNGHIYSSGNTISVTGTASSDVFTLNSGANYTANNFLLQGSEPVSPGDAVDTDTFNFDATTVLTLIVNGWGGSDTFNINQNVAGTISGDTHSDIFNIKSNVDALIEGNDGNDEFNILASGINVTVDAGIAGNANNDVLMGFYDSGDPFENIWTLTSNNAGTLENNGATIRFSGMERLVGGNGVDTYFLNASLNSDNNRGDINIGQVDGGGGADTFTLNNTITIGEILGGEGDDLFTLNGNARLTGSLNGGNNDDEFIFISGSSISSVLVDSNSNSVDYVSVTGGDGNDTIESYNSNENWILTGSNSGTNTMLNSGSLNDFEGIESLIGSGTDTLTSSNNDTTWTIQQLDEVGSEVGDYRIALTNVSGDIKFSGMNILQGGSGVDIFNINSVFTGDIKGGLEGDEFNFSANVVGDVYGEAGNNSFIITAAGLTLNLLGGTGTDSVALNIDGDTADHTWLITGDKAGLLDTTITFSGVEILVGSSGSGMDTLTAENQTNTWVVNASTGGTVEDSADNTNDANDADLITFSAMDILQGGTGADTFDVSASFLGDIKGGAGADIFNLLASDLRLTLAGEGDTDQLIGFGNSDLDNLWASTGDMGGTITYRNSDDYLSNDGSDIAVTFEGVETLIGGSETDEFILGHAFTQVQGGSGDNSFIITAAGLTLDLLGGAGTDSVALNIDGDTADHAWLLTGDKAGSLDATITFSGVETLEGSSGSGIDTLTAESQTNTWIVNALAGGTVEDSSDYEGDADDADLVTFSAMDILQGGTGADTFDVSVSFLGDIKGGAGADVFNLLASDLRLTLAGEGDDDQLIGFGNSDLDNLWASTGDMGGTITYRNSDDALSNDGSDIAVTFEGVETLIGGSETDEFTLGHAFTHVQGGSGDNSFIIIAAGLTLDLLGGTGTDSVALNIDGDTADHAWLLTGDKAGSLDATITFSGVETLEGSSGSGDDTLTAESQTNTWIVNALTGGTVEDSSDNEGDADDADLVTFSAMDILQGGTGADTFDVSASFLGDIKGGAGADAFNLLASDLRLTLAGEGDTDQLIGFGNSDLDNLWASTGDMGGTITYRNSDDALSNDGSDIAVTFEGVETLIGGSKTDEFTLGHAFTHVQGGSGDNSFIIIAAGLTLDLLGGTGTDSVALNIDGDTADHAWLLTGDKAGSLDATITFSGVETLEGSSGSGDDTLTAESQTNTWIVNALTGGTVEDSSDNEGDADDADLVTFSAMDILQGGTGADTFDVSASFLGDIKGGAGADVFNLLASDLRLTLAGEGDTDQLIGFGNSDLDNLWASTGDMGGTITYRNSDDALSNDGSDIAVTFEGVETLIGGSKTDEFTLGHAFTHVQGGSGNNSFIITAAGLTLDLLGGTGTDSVVLNIDGDTADHAWLLTGDKAGSLDATITFSGVETLVGSSGSGMDTLTAESQTNTWIVNALAGGTVEDSSDNEGDADDADLITFSAMEVLAGRSLVDVFTFSELGSINSIIGGDGNDRIVGNSLAIDWTINGANSGSVDYITSFSSIEYLDGSDDSADTFSFFTGGSVIGIDGGTGSGDSVSYAAVTDNIVVTIGDASINGLTNIELVEGNNDGLTNITYQSTLVGGNFENTWRIGDFDGAIARADGYNDGVVSVGQNIQFVNFNNLTVVRLPMFLILVCIPIALCLEQL